MKYARMHYFWLEGKHGCPPEAPHGIFYGILYSLPLWAVIAIAAWEAWR